MTRSALVLIAVTSALPLFGTQETLLKLKLDASPLRSCGTSRAAEIVDGVARLADDSRYYYGAAAGNVCLPGKRLTVAVEARGTNDFKVGLFCYGEKTVQVWGDPMRLTNDFTRFQRTFTVPIDGSEVRVAFQGAGDYRSAELTHDFDPIAELKVPVPPEADAALSALGDRVSVVRRTDILWLGDSLSDFSRGKNHTDLIAHYLNRREPGTVRLYNYAVAGDFITRTLDRVNGKKGTWKLARHHDFDDRSYDWAFVFLGANDTKASSATNYEKPFISLEDEERGFVELIAKLRQRGVRRIVLISSHSSDFAFNCEKSEKIKKVHNRFGDPRHIEAYNAVLRRIAAERGCEYLDLYTEMRARPDKVSLLRPNDGVHLSDAGCRFVAEKVLGYLAEHPRKSLALPPDVKVELPASAGASTRYAAEELRRFLGQLGSAAGEAAQKVVLRETDEFGDEGFRLRVADGVVEIAGGVRGVLYGVYELLERFGGIEWLASWQTVVPKVRPLVVPAALESVQRPVFKLRNATWCDAFENADFAARLRYNGWKFGLGEKHGGIPTAFGGDLEGHTFYRLFPKRLYPADKHPDCYARNQVALENPDDLQLCLSNPFVLEVVTSNVLEHIRKGPKGLFYSVSKKDGARNWCRCPKCAAVDAEEGSSAGTLVRFLNKVGEAVEREFPDAKLTTLVYTWSRKPPTKTKIRGNIVPYFCTYEADFSAPLDESPYPGNRTMMDDLRGWCAQSSDMIIWDYVTCFYNYLFTYPNVSVLRPNLRLFRDLDCLYMARAQGDSKGAHGDFAELKAWLLAKWMWDPGVPEEELLCRFMRGYYGAAAPFVREYYDGLHAQPRDRIRDPLRLYESAEFGKIPDAFLEEAERLWTKAEEAVKDDPVRSYNVRMGKLSVAFGQLARLTLPNAKHKAPSDPSAAAAERERVKALARWIRARCREARYPIRFAENTRRNNMLAQMIEDAGEFRYPCENLTWTWTPSGSPFSFELSEDETFAAATTRTWQKLREPRCTIGGLKPGRVYHWRTKDCMGRREQGHFTTEGGTAGPSFKTKTADGSRPDDDGWIPAN